MFKQSREDPGLSNFRSNILDVLAEGDRVVLRRTAEGIHTGNLTLPTGDVLPPTGKQVRWAQTIIYQVVDGVAGGIICGRLGRIV